MVHSMGSENLSLCLFEKDAHIANTTQLAVYPRCKCERAAPIPCLTCQWLR